METVPALNDCLANLFELPEVIERIVKYLEPKDLIKCRLVNKSWEKEANKEIGKKFTLRLSRTTQDTSISLHPINDKGFFNYLQLNQPNVNLQGGPQLIPPLIQNLAITKYPMLSTDLFTSVGPFLRKLIFHGCETHQFRALDIILTNCMNLEYLDFTTWGDFENNMITTIQNYQLVDTFEDEQAINNIKLLKLKTLFLKFTKYHSTMEDIYYKFVSNILNKVPNLQVLELPYYESSRRIIMPPGIIRALLEFMPRLTKLQKLNIGYRFNYPAQDNNNELFQLLSCTKFQLLDLKLNENLQTILPIIIYHQRKLINLTASSRHFNWGIFQQWLRTTILPTIHQPNGKLRIQLIDFYNLQRCNIMEMVLYKRQQVAQQQLEIAAAAAANAIVFGNIGGILVGHKSCPNSAFNFFLSFNTLMHSDHNIINTIATLNLCNVGSLELTDIVNLAQLRSLVRLQFKPITDNVLKNVWIMLGGLRELFIILGEDFQQPSYVFESAICGENVQDCYAQFIKYSEKPNTLEEMFALLPTGLGGVGGRIPDGCCVCRLQNLRTLIIKNCVPGHFKYLTELSIMKCFYKLSLAYLKMPYKGSRTGILHLQAMNPALDLELED